MKKKFEKKNKPNSVDVFSSGIAFMVELSRAGIIQMYFEIEL